MYQPSKGQHKFEKHVIKYFFCDRKVIFLAHERKLRLQLSLILDFMVFAWDSIAVLNPQCIM